MAGFLLGAAGMFAVTYSTQAILPELGSAFHVSPSQAGLTISVVVLALASGAWIWGPFSDRYGRRRSIVLASTLVVAPTIGAALAPSFGVLLAFRALQGLCMPGLLTAGLFARRGPPSRTGPRPHASSADCGTGATSLRPPSAIGRRVVGRSGIRSVAGQSRCETRGRLRARAGLADRRAGRGAVR